MCAAFMSYEPVPMLYRPAGNLDGLDLGADVFAVLGGGEPRRDVVIAREAVGLEVLAAILDPLDRPAEHEAGDRAAHVAGIDRDLAAEPAADVGRDDLDHVLGQRS